MPICYQILLLSFLKFSLGIAFYLTHNIHAYLLNSAQPTISVEELINGSPSKTTTLEFESTTTRSIDLVPLLSFSIVCEIKGNDQFTSTPWTVDGTSLDQQPSVSMAYYTSPTSFQRQLVFQNFSSAMSGNYTCTTIDGSRILLIGESKCS